jgi:capsid protein
MARSGDVIEHLMTGERITFFKTSKETNGEYTVFERRSGRSRKTDGKDKE